MASSQRRGRLNVSAPSQRIVLGKFRPLIIPGSALLTTSTDESPTPLTVAHTYSPSFSSASVGTLFLRQNPVAAAVGVTPSASNARADGGPLTRASLLSCPGASADTRTTMRRGVAPTVTPACSRPPFFRHASTACTSCAAPDATSAAGSSSVPTSRKKSAAAVGGGWADTGGGAARVGSQTPRGNPSSSRRATHSTADSRASLRMLAKSFARSVTPTAPRASRILNAWLALSRLS
mmetsp:Transcript_24993/g.62402  ORF Transcript_24993/g.62402 Transcript_24993/m.62402 type:complete len:236 (+) Transcript_24993:3056-3763(+)